MKEFCVDFELAKELKENGFPQNHNFSYDINGTLWTACLEDFSAPCSDEILKELPREIEDKNFKYFYHLTIEKSPINDEMYFISYGITKQNRAWMQQYNTSDKILSNALAKMWLYLKKEGYIK